MIKLERSRVTFCKRQSTPVRKNCFGSMRSRCSSACPAGNVTKARGELQTSCGGDSELSLGRACHTLTASRSNSCEFSVPAAPAASDTISSTLSWGRAVRPSSLSAPSDPAGFTDGLLMIRPTVRAVCTLLKAPSLSTSCRLHERETGPASFLDAFAAERTADAQYRSVARESQFRPQLMLCPARHRSSLKQDARGGCASVSSPGWHCCGRYRQVLPPRLCYWRSRTGHKNMRLKRGPNFRGGVGSAESGPRPRQSFISVGYLVGANLVERQQ